MVACPVEDTRTTALEEVDSSSDPEEELNSMDPKEVSSMEDKGGTGTASTKADTEEYYQGLYRILNFFPTSKLTKLKNHIFKIQN